MADVQKTKTSPKPPNGRSTMTIKWLLLVGLSLSFVGQQAAFGQTIAGQHPNVDPRRLRAIVEAGAQEAHTKAVVFGVWVDQREILTGALGNSMTTQPATTDMHYRIGGIAETFMSTLLLMLVEQGRIGLDDTIARWFPHLLAADRVTVRMLVGNTAGYIDYVTEDDFAKLQSDDPFRTFTDDDLINYSTRYGKMNFAPGTSQQYSHTDNVILGQVIQRATKQSLKELYNNNIFGPLRMLNTQIPTGQEIQAPVLHAFTMERQVYEDCTYWNPSWGSTPAMATSNIHDLGKWGPILGTGRLISPAHFKEQIAPTSAGKGNNRSDLYFAYGFVYANGWILQNPNINGYSGGLAYNLSSGVTIVVEATKSEAKTADGSAFAILRSLVAYVTPKSPINF
jgi:D-alanyl-D-alanine carboxypeptidase